MRIAIASSSRVAIPTLSAIEESNHDLIELITTPDAPAGRGRNLTSNEFAQWANDSGRAIFKPADMAELTILISKLEPDLIITIAYGKLIPELLLKKVEYGWLNLHFSLLPRWRGAAPVQWAIKSGDSETGVSVFQLDNGMDTGPIFVEKKLRIADNSTTDSLLDELSVLGSVAVLETLDLLASGNKPRPQFSRGNLAPKISKADAEIDWNASNAEIDCHIRAMTSNPGAWSRIGATRIVINRARKMQEKLNPGELRKIENTIAVGTGDGSIGLEKVTPEGKRMMDSLDWFRGARIEEGRYFG